MGFGCLDTNTASFFPPHAPWETAPGHTGAYNPVLVWQGEFSDSTRVPNTAGERGPSARRQQSTKLTKPSGASKHLTSRKSSIKKRFSASQPAWSIPFDLQRCIEMVSQMNGSSEAQQAAVSELEAAFASLAFDVQGCRVAQEALELACLDVKVKFALKLRGHIMEAIGSPFANYVVQKTIEVLPPLNVQFIVNELAGSVVSVARHSYGVRVLCRLLEHCPPPMIEELVFKLTENADHLCRHKFGTYIVQHILEYGTSEQCRVVMKALTGNALKLVEQRPGCELILCALSNPELVKGSALLARLVKDRALLELAPNNHKYRVLHALSQLRGSELEDM